MKWLLLIIPFLAHANYADPDAVDHTAKTNFSVYMKKSVCDRETGKACIKIPSGFDYEYHEKSGSDIIMNQTKKTAYDAQKASDIADAAAKKSARDAAKANLKAADCALETGVVKDLCLQYK